MGLFSRIFGSSTQREPEAPDSSTADSSPPDESGPQKEDRDRWDIFTPRERLIYKYWNGTEYIEADPMMLYKRVMDKGPGINADMKLVNSPMKLKNGPSPADAHNRMVKEMRWIFDLGPKQLHELDVIELFDHFLNFCHEVKKNTSLYQTLPTSTEESAQPSEESLPTSKSSDSGSTESEVTTDELTPSPSESESPSEVSSQESPTTVP